MDDEGKPYARQKKKPVFEDEGLEAARDIFGCDFDYGEFEQYEGEGLCPVASRVNLFIYLFCSILVV